MQLGETPQANEHEGRTFPDEGQNDNISCLALTSNFLIYGTEVKLTTSLYRFISSNNYYQDGSITYFYLEDWHFVNEFKHVVGKLELWLLEYLTNFEIFIEYITSCNTKN